MSGNNAWLGGENQNAGGGQREVRWLTPPHIPAALGKFDLDPCGAPGHALATHTYLLENGDDGLRDPWEGRVWLNPPYGKAQEPFMRRMVQHGHGTALIFARTETRQWHELVWPEASAILFLRGRLCFLDASGARAGANAGAPSVLIAYGDEDAAALAASGLPGHLVQLKEEVRV